MASKDLVFRWLSLDAGAGREFDRMAGKASHAHGVFNALAVGVAATGVTVGVAAVKMADNFETAHNRLVSALLNTGQTVKGTEAPIAAANKRLESLGFNSAQTADSMAKLEVATKNPAKSIKDLSLAADLARGRNIDLASASAILVKVETGHVALLGRLGIATKDAAGHTISQQEALKRLTQLYGGDASRYTETFAGKQAVLRAELTDMGTKLGLVLIPALLKVADVVSKDVVPKLETFGGWVSRNKTPIEDLAKVLGTIAAFKFASGKLNDISHLLGFGSKGLGGVGGGIISSAKPIPVFVTNEGFGGGKGVPGLPGGGRGVPGEPVPVGRLRSLRGLARAIPLVGTAVVGAELARDYTKGQNAASARRLLKAAQTPSGVIELQNLYTQGMTALPHQGGFQAASTKIMLSQIDAALKSVGASLSVTDKGFKNLGTSVKHSANDIDNAKSQMADFHSMTTAQRRAVNTTIAQFQRIPGAMTQVAAQANAAGLSIGSALDAGITVGIKQGSGQVAIVSTQVIDGVRTSMMKHAKAASPSKMTMEIGRWLSEGLGIGMKQGEAMVAKSSKSLISTVLSRLGTLKGDRSGMASGISSNLIQGGSLSNMPLASLTTGFGTSYTAAPTVAGMQAFLSGYAGRERTFGRNLALARKKGLSPVEAANIAQMGLDAGGPLAAALAGGSVAQNRSVSALTAQVTAAANQIGTAAAGANYDRQIAELQQVVAELQHLPQAIAKALTSPHATKALATSATRTRRAK